MPFPGIRPCLHVAGAVAALIAAPPALSCIANPNPIEETQPDGTRIVLHFRGDKRFHWYEDAKGYTALRNADGYYVHAALGADGALAPTKSRVGLDDPAASALLPGILPDAGVIERISSARLATPPEFAAKSASKAITPIGTVKNLVILARFSNHTGRTLPSVSDFNTLFNTVGGHGTLAPTGSVRDVYTEMSYGQMTLQSTVLAWVTLPQTETYYANNDSGLTTRTHDLIRDALAAADGLVDFDDFDTDADGYVDSIAFVHSGYGAEWGGTDQDGTDMTDRIWSHRWSLFTGEFTSAEGTRVYDYHINPALWSTSGSAIGRVGVICHETGHFFGLPDLYDTVGTGQGAGSWCMMANSWGFSGQQLRPPHFSPWCKIELGWLAPITISVGGTHNIAQVQTNAVVHKITSNFPSQEYLLLENRNKTGYDADIPAAGLAVWHIDDTASHDDEGYPGQAGWPENGLHYRVALLQADGNYDLEKNVNTGDGGDLYRSGGVTAIGPSTVPSTDTYKGGNVADTGISITSIGAAGSTMSYTLALAAGADGPEINVSSASGDVVDGGGPVNFGNATQGGIGLQKTFLVENSGTQTLTTSGLSVPSGYSIVEPLAASIAAGANDSFAVGLSTANSGTFTGTIQFSNNDANENPFNFTVTGTIQGGGSAGSASNSCSTATPIAAGQTGSGSTSGATNDGAATCGDSASSPDVWYSYQALCDGTATISLCGSAYDTVLSVHTACPSAGTQIACNDDDPSAACGVDSVLSFNVAASTTYLIRIAGYGGAVGSYAIDLDVECDIVNPLVQIDPSEVVVECVPAPAPRAAAEVPFRNPSADVLPPRASKFAGEAELFASFDKSTDGTAEVVVTLQQPWATLAATDWRSPKSVAALHADTAALASVAIESIPAQEMQVLHRFENQAGFSAVVTRAGLDLLEQNDLVYAIEPSFPIHAQMAQGLPLMNASTARSTFTGNGLSVAICDTGIDYDHPRLGDGGFPNSKVLGGYDFGDDDANPDSDGNAHGTACAGIAAGATGTVGDYIGGVAPDAKLYALKMSPGGSGSATSEAMIASWDWCVTHWNDNPSYPIKVISTSFGGGRYTATCNADTPAMTMAAANAVALGITVLAASGNDGYCDSIAWPACIVDVIAVGAVYDAAVGSKGWCVNSASCHPNRQANGGCSTGWVVFENGATDVVTAYSNTATFLDIFAPSNDASTPDIVGAGGYTSGDYTTSFGGTSAACPYAAGGVALLQSAAKAIGGDWLTPAEMRTLLAQTGNVINDPKTSISKPRVNIGNALATLGATGNLETFVVSNPGQGDLEVTTLSANKGANWLDVLAPMPITVLGGSSQTVLLRINCGLAPPGESVVTLTTNSNATNGEDSVDVRVINGPEATVPNEAWMFR